MRRDRRLHCLRPECGVLRPPRQHLVKLTDAPSERSHLVEVKLVRLATLLGVLHDRRKPVEMVQRVRPGVPLVAHELEQGHQGDGTAAAVERDEAGERGAGSKARLGQIGSHFDFGRRALAQPTVRFQEKRLTQHHAGIALLAREMLHGHATLCVELEELPGRTELEQAVAGAKVSRRAQVLHQLQGEGRVGKGINQHTHTCMLAHLGDRPFGRQLDAGLVTLPRDGEREEVRVLLTVVTADADGRQQPSRRRPRARAS